MVYWFFRKILSRSSKTIFVIALTTVFTINCIASTKSLRNSQEHIEIGTNENTTAPLLKVDVEYVEIDKNIKSSQQISERVAEATNQSQSTVVLSSDNPVLIAQTVKDKNTNPENLNIVPIEDIQKQDLTEIKNNHFLHLTKNFVVNSYESAKNDKIGVLILTYTTAAESLVWYHSTNLSQFEKTSNIVYTIALALALSLNKDSWSNATRPFQKFFKSIFENKIKNATLNDIATRYFGNLALSTIVTYARIPLMSMNDIIDKGLQLEYFTMPLLLSVIMTSAYFTWSEHIAMINEKTHPITKFIFRRAYELRSVIAGTFATTAALLAPTQYGLTPWLTLSGIGVAGGFVFFNRDAISDWLENNKSLQNIKARFSGQKTNSTIRLQCHGLFVQ